MDDHPKLSRRSILKEAALVAGATLAATLFPSKEVFAQKASKEAMKYQDHPDGDKQCSNCAQFVPSNSCTTPASFRFVDTRPTTTGAVLHVYERAGDLKYGEFEVGEEIVIFDSDAPRR